MHAASPLLIRPLSTVELWTKLVEHLMTLGEIRYGANCHVRFATTQLDTAVLPLAAETGFAGVK